MRRQQALLLRDSRRWSSSSAASGAGLKVCVTGASGFVGLHVTQTLLRRGYLVHGTVRDTANRQRCAPLAELSWQFPGQLKLYEARLQEPGCLDEAVRGCHGCFHVASPHPNPLPTGLAELQRSIIEPAVAGTRSAVRACARAGPQLRRLVHTSSFAAVTEVGNPSKPEGYFYDESDWNTFSHVGGGSLEAKRASKVQAEAALWDAMLALESGDGEDANNEEDGSAAAPTRSVAAFDAVALNPSLIMGPALRAVESRRDLSLSSLILLHLVTGSYPLVPRSGNAWVDVADVAEAHVRAFETEAAGGRRYLITPGCVSYREVCDVLRAMYPGAAVPSECAAAPPVGGRGWRDSVSWLWGESGGAVAMAADVHFGVDASRSVAELGMRWRPLHDSLRRQVECFRRADLVDF